LGKAASAVGGRARNVGGRALDAATVASGAGINYIDDILGINTRGIAGKAGDIGKGLFGKGKGFAKKMSDFGGEVISRGLGENIFRFARAQEKIPLWGGFAKKFGGGAEVAKQTAAFLRNQGGVMGAARATGSLTSGATLMGEAGAAASGGMLAKVATKAALPLMLLTTSLEAMGQAFKTSERAAEIFETAVSDVGHAQRMAAENAGFLTGVLNTLTFGIFSHWIGATGSITDSLARFLNQFQLLNVALSVLMIPLKVVYGVFWGLAAALGEIFKGIWEGIKQIIEPFGDALSAIWDGMKELWAVVVDVFSPLKEVFGEFGEGISIVDALIGGLRGVGMVIGWLLKMTGWLISTPFRALALGLKGAIMLIVGLAKVVGAVLKPFVTLVSKVIGTVVDFFGILWKIVSGFFTLDIKKFGSGIIDMFKLAVRNLPGVLTTAFGYLASSVLSIFTSLASSISGIFGSVINWISNLPLIKQALGAANMVSGAVGGAWNWAKEKIFGFASGGAITESGLAMIHAGELVIPKDHANDIMLAHGEPVQFGGKGGFGEINARPLTDIQTQVEQEYASSGPATASVSSAELSMIATLTQNQLTIMTEQLSELRDIKSYLAPGAGSNAQSAGSSRSNTKPPNSPNYYNLSFGGYGGNASKGIVNDGVT
jgi:hypothetical protein